MKHLLFFIESLGCGGAEKSLLALLHSLDYSRVQVDLLLLIDGGIFREQVPPQVRVLTLTSMPGWGNRRQRLGHLKYSAMIRAYRLAGIHRHNAETLWSSEGKHYPSLPGHYDVAIAYQQGLPTYYIAHKVDADKKLAWVNVDLDSAGYRGSYNKPHYRHFDKVVAVSERLVQPLCDSGYTTAGHIAVIYDILSTPLIRQMSTAPLPSPFDTAFKKECVQWQIVTVGRMSRQKNYPLAIRAAKILKDNGLSFRWTFVGDGIERQLIDTMIREMDLGDRVITAGVQSNPYPFIKSADIYVHTATFEGYGLTIAEAKILGKPVISTDFTVVTDQIEHGRNGLITKMTAESVADSIMRITADAELRQRITQEIQKEENTTQATEIVKFNHLIGEDSVARPRTVSAINIAFCVNDGYVPFIAPALLRIAELHRHTTVEVHILSDDISEASKRRLADEIGDMPWCTLSFYDVDDTPLRALAAMSKYTWYRLLIQHTLPSDIDKVLYLDADTLVSDDLTPIFEADYSGCSVAGVIDPLTFDDATYLRCGYPKSEGYLCAGVLMLNLAYWREHDLADKMIRWANAHPDIKLHDQDVINILCHDTKRELPLRYGIIDNLFHCPGIYGERYRGEAVECFTQPAIIHYAGSAPWFTDGVINPWWYMWDDTNIRLRRPAARRYKTRGLLNLKIRIADMLHPDYRRRNITFCEIASKLHPEDRFPTIIDIDASDMSMRDLTARIHTESRGLPPLQSATIAVSGKHLGATALARLQRIADDYTKDITIKDNNKG